MSEDPTTPSPPGDALSSDDSLPRPGHEAPDRLEQLAASDPLLGTALLELRGAGISNPVADALVTARVDDSHLSEFLRLVVRELTGRQLFGMAISLSAYIDRRAVGHEAMDFCLQPGRLGDSELEHVGLSMRAVTTPTAVVWCHSRLTSAIRNDGCYYLFLQTHADVVIEQCFDEMTSYLLHPYRGPEPRNVDSFEIVFSRADRTGALERRWIEWINDGYFDRPGPAGRAPAHVLYMILNDHWGDPRFDAIANAVEGRVSRLLKADPNEEVRDGLYHLVAMVDARYRGTERILNAKAPRPQDLPDDQRVLLERIVLALRAVADHNLVPDNAVMKRLVNDRLNDVFNADRTGITGHWKAH